MRPVFTRARTWFALFATSLLISWGITLRPGLTVATQLPPRCAPTPTTCPTCSKVEDTPIPEVGTITSTINVSGVGSSLLDLILITHIEHRSNADLKITLTKKSVTGNEDIVVTITDHNGGPNANVFDGTRWKNNANRLGQVPYTPNHRFNEGLVTDHPYANYVRVMELTPQESFGAFIGEDPKGDWVLTITDDQKGNVGKLKGWSLEIASLPSAPVETTHMFGAPTQVPTPIPTSPDPRKPLVVTSKINVSVMGAQLGRLGLTTLIRHTFNADLDITLTSPMGAIVTITTDNGGSNDNVFDGTLWDDKADAGQDPVSSLVTRHPYADKKTAMRLVPEEPFAAFNGEDPNGDWTLTIYDDNAGDGGTLMSWSLEVTTITCAVADLSLAKEADQTLPGEGANILFTITVSNGNDPGTAAATNVAVKDQLPAGLSFVLATPSQGTYNSETGIWTVGTLARATSASLQITAQVTGQGKVTNTAEVSASDQLDPDSMPNNNIPTEDDQKSVTLSLPSFEVSDQKVGSVLFYNVYSSSASNPNAENTRINITNTNSASAAIIHLFFVEGTTCAVADTFISLTPSQTISLLASDLDPGVTGYLIAVAVNANGCPTAFNYLIGDAYIKFATGHIGNLGAEAFSALSGVAPSCRANSMSATLNFDGVSYNLAPRVLALDNIPSRADGNNTLLIINRLGGDLTTRAVPIGPVFGLLFDDAGNSVSFTFTSSGCQFRSLLSNNFPDTTPRFDVVIPAGRSGWLKFWAESDASLLGASFNNNPNVATSAVGYRSAHNLHELRLTTSALTIPVLPPSC